MIFDTGFDAIIGLALTRPFAQHRQLDLMLLISADMQHLGCTQQQPTSKQKQFQSLLTTNTSDDSKHMLPIH